MAAWQIVLLVFLVLLPLALLADFHPRRERLNSGGEPLLPRDWTPPPARRDASEAEDH